MRGLCVLALSSVLVSAEPCAAQHFKSLELGDAPGTMCPGSGRTCTNGAAEPAIRAAADGAIYASSELGLGAGTEAWKSTDGGLHYTTLVSPNQTSSGSGVSPAGGDTDLTIAPEKNGAGQYNVYVASLSGANIVVSTSEDGGTTWAMNATSASIPGDDREWIAADGPATVCISYHDLATSNLDVNCSANAGATFTQVGDAIDATHPWLVGNNAIGTLAIDAASHIIYQAFNAIGAPTEVSCAGIGTCDFHGVWMAVSIDGGQTFTDHVVYTNPDTTVGYEHSFVQVSVDRGGNVYAVFSDDHTLYYSFSMDHGATWSAPAQVNRRPARTAIFPWSVAGDAGRLDVVWYGSPYVDAATMPDAFPETASWRVYFAQNVLATTPGSSFKQVAATPVIHKGGICESGITCNGNRDLFDDFGVTASPTTGRAAIAYSDDRYTTNAANPPQAGCTRTGTNSSACVHTSVATQVKGLAIFGP